MVWPVSIGLVVSAAKNQNQSQNMRGRMACGIYLLGHSLTRPWYFFALSPRGFAGTLLAGRVRSIRLVFMDAEKIEQHTAEKRRNRFTERPPSGHRAH